MNFLEKIKSGCADLSPSCRDAIRAQSDALDRPLPPAKGLGLWLHLILCKWCRRYGKQIQFLHTAAHEHPDALTESLPEKLSGDARERIKRRLQAKS